MCAAASGILSLSFSLSLSPSLSLSLYPPLSIPLSLPPSLSLSLSFSPSCSPLMFTLVCARLFQCMCSYMLFMCTRTSVLWWGGQSAPSRCVADQTFMVKCNTGQLWRRRVCLAIDRRFRTYLKLPIALKMLKGWRVTNVGHLLLHRTAEDNVIQDKLQWLIRTTPCLTEYQEHLGIRS